MRSAFAQQGMSCHVQHAHDSLIFRTSKGIPGSSVHSAIELFPDESMKLTVPGVMLDPHMQEEALRQISALDIEVPANALFIGATETLRRVTRMASLLDRYVRCSGRKRKPMRATSATTACCSVEQPIAEAAFAILTTASTVHSALVNSLAVISLKRAGSH